MSAGDAKAGVYCITCNANGRVYVGSAINLARRWRQHRSSLNRGDHHSCHLMRAWQKYGPDAFEWSILELVPIDGLTKTEAKPVLLAREQHYIDTLGVDRFNTLPTAGSSLGVKLTVEASAKRSEAARRVWQAPERRAKQAETLRRIAQDPEWLAKRAEAARLAWQAPERLAKHTEALRRRSQDPVWQAKQAEAMHRRSQDPVYRAKQAEAMHRRSQDPVYRAKQAEAMHRRSQDPVYRAKQAEAMHRRSQDPVWLAKNAEAARRRSQDPEWLANNVEAVRRRSQDPEWLANHAEANRRRSNRFKTHGPEYAEARCRKWQDPVYRAMMTAAMRESWRRRREAKLACQTPTKLVQGRLFA